MDQIGTIHEDSRSIIPTKCYLCEKEAKYIFLFSNNTALDTCIDDNHRKQALSECKNGMFANIAKRLTSHDSKNLYEIVSINMTKTSYIEHPFGSDISNVGSSIYQLDMQARLLKSQAKLAYLKIFQYTEEKRFLDTQIGKEAKSISNLNTWVNKLEECITTLRKKYIFKLKWTSKCINQRCTICMKLIDETERNAGELICGHVFHSSCIEKWFLENASCPCCRKSCDLDEFYTPRFEIDSN